MQGIRLGQGNACLLKSGGKAVMKGEEEKEPQPSQISSRNVPVINWLSENSCLWVLDTPWKIGV